MNFMKYRWLFFAISLVVLTPSIFSLIFNGLKPAIDFRGGSLIEVRTTQDSELTLEEVQQLAGDVYEIHTVQSLGSNIYGIQGDTISNEQQELVVAQLQEQYGDLEPLGFQSVGATISQELLQKTVAAVILVAGIITLYVWRQFDEIRFGICAILAMLHDSIVLLGAFSLLGYFFGIQVDILFVTALLTTLSFSIHDTIVVFDRVRELSRKNRRANFEEVVNTAVIETLGRSINNSVTIIVMLAALALIGGESIRWFAVALLIGAVTGTYSSTFTAAPLLLLWDDIIEKVKRRK